MKSELIAQCIIDAVSVVEHGRKDIARRGAVQPGSEVEVYEHEARAEGARVETRDCQRWCQPRRAKERCERETNALVKTNVHDDQVHGQPAGFCLASLAMEFLILVSLQLSGHQKKISEHMSNVSKEDLVSVLEVTRQTTKCH